MSTRWLRLGLMGAGVSLLAACAGEQVWLGQARLEAADCGDDECADAGPAQPPVEPPTFAMADPSLPPLVEVAVSGRCEVPVSGQLTIAQHVTGCGPEASPGCNFFFKTLVPDADGGAWIVGGPNVSGEDSPPSTTQWLMRYRGDGSLRCKVAVDSVRPALAIDDGGSAWLARIYALGEPSDVQRYDRDCQAIGAPLAGLNEVRAITNIPGAGVAIANGLDDQRVTLHDASGQALWSRPGPGQFHVAIAAANASAFVLGTTPRRGGASGVTVRALDADGDARWQADTQASTLAAAFSNYLVSGSDQQGNLVLAFTPSDPLGQDGRWYDLDLESLDAAGQTRWVLRVPSFGNPAVAVAQNGEVYVASPRSNSERETIAAIAQDGGSCRRLKYEGLGIIDKLAVSPTGQLWYVTASEFGRFGPLP